MQPGALAISVVIHQPEPKAYHSSRKYVRIFSFTPTIRLVADVLLWNLKQSAEHSAISWLLHHWPLTPTRSSRVRLLGTRRGAGFPSVAVHCNTSRAGRADTTTVFIFSTESKPVLGVSQVYIQCVVRYLYLWQSSRSVTLLYCHSPLTLTAHADSRRPLNAEAQLRSQDSLSKIPSTGTAISPRTSVFPSQRHSTNARYSSAGSLQLRLHNTARTNVLLFTNRCTIQLSYNTILKFTLKQLRHVSVQLHHLQGAQ